MKRCDVIEMRENLLVVELYKKNGIDFVPIPVINAQDKAKFKAIGEQQLDKLVTIVEKS